MSLGAAQSPNECHRLRNSEIIRHRPFLICIKADFAAPHHVSRDGDGVAGNVPRLCIEAEDMMPIYRHTKKHDLRRGRNGARLRGAGAVFDLRRGERLYARIRLSRLSVRRRQRCGGVRDRQSLLRPAGRAAAADDRRQAQLQYGPGQVRDRRRGVLGHRRLHASGCGRRSSSPFRCSISICPGSRSAASGRCTPRR